VHRDTSLRKKDGEIGSDPRTNGEGLESEASLARLKPKKKIIKWCREGSVRETGIKEEGKNSSGLLPAESPRWGRMGMLGKGNPKSGISMSGDRSKAGTG